MKYKVVRNVDGRFACDFFDGESSLITGMAELGFQSAGREDGSHLLPHLQGQPRFNELHGPMGDSEGGAPIVRYEDWAVSNALSE